MDIDAEARSVVSDLLLEGPEYTAIAEYYEDESPEIINAIWNTAQAICEILEGEL